MTKAALNPAQRKTVELIEALQFGSIEGLTIRNGLPSYETEPRVIQTIKLDSTEQVQLAPIVSGETLKNNFDQLFDQLTRIKNGAVTVEVRHSLPFRLVIERGMEGLI